MEIALGWSPIRLDIIEEQGERWTEPGNYPSNGPYLLDAWVHGEKVVLVKNPTYWNADAVGIEQITLPIIEDDASVVATYEEDELHSTGEKYSEVLLLRSQADPVLSQELRVLPRPGVHYMGLNTRRPPTDDVLVRKALALAIDRQSWLQNAAPASCTTPPTIPGHQPYGACGHTFDPEQARALLAEAGYPGGEDFPPLQAWINRGGNERHIETVAAMWEENLGISVEVDVYEWDRYLDFLDGCNDGPEALAACELNLYLMGWIMDYGDAQNQLEVVFAPYSTYHYTGWQSERYEELMALASTELDRTQRAEYYKEADKILCEAETAIIPIFSYEWKTLVKEGVTFEFPPFSHPAFKHWALP